VIFGGGGVGYGGLVVCFGGSFGFGVSDGDGFDIFIIGDFAYEGCDFRFGGVGGDGVGCGVGSGGVGGDVDCGNGVVVVLGCCNCGSFFVGFGSGGFIVSGGTVVVLMLILLVVLLVVVLVVLMRVVVVVVVVVIFVVD